MAPNAHIKHLRQISMANLKRKVDQEEGNPLDIALETIDHIVDHYYPEGEKYETDHLLIVCGGYFGMTRATGECHHSVETLYLGNLEALAHSMAIIMEAKPHLAKVIQLAVHLYQNPDSIQRGG